jgi:chaperone required for assembly of F1-ATPase
MSLKRFYKMASVSEQDGGYAVLLDGRTLKTPGKKPLILGTQNIADLIAAEWNAQEEEIKTETMPITRLMNVAVERTPDNREALIREARSYAGTDLLCYRAEVPVDLARRQSGLWDPLLDWARSLNIDLKVTEGIIALTQSESSLNAAADYARGLDDTRLTLLVHLIAVYGSAVLGIGVLEAKLTGEQAFDLSRLDEIYQIEQWGEDEDAVKRTANIRSEVRALCKIIEPQT